MNWIFAFIFNFTLILFAQKLPLLTKSGWIHAGILGTLLIGSIGIKGWLAVAIYLLLGSLVTKVGYKYKQSRGIAEARDGKRGPENVWGSADTGAFMAILTQVDNMPTALLLIGFASSFSAKLADTFGSEIGKRYGTKTFLITNFKTVKPGTDGGVSIEGTAASLLGSFLMTIPMVFLRIIPLNYVVYIVIVSGFLGTLFESLVGAIFQDKNKWLTNEVVNFIQTALAAILSISLAIIFN